MSRPPTPPDDALDRLLPPDVRGEVTDLRHPEAVEVWHGIVWSRLGRCELAWAWWDGVESPELAAWIAAERGRVLRELGLHEAAERHDEAGLEIATDIVDVCMLRIGLTADAVGHRDLEQVGLRLESVAPLLATLPDGPRVARQRLRLSWVRIEVALLAGEEPPLDELPRWVPNQGVRFPDDYAHGSEFHAAKGLLFAGIARRDSRLLEGALEIAPPMLAWAVQLARADRDRDGALEAAREAWTEIVPPPEAAAAAARTPTAQRLTGRRRPGR